MPELRIEISEEMAASIAAAFPENADAPEALAQIALAELVGWMTGDRRPAKLTDQNIARVAAIYEHLLLDDVPDVQTLVRRFNLPVGQARYIVQSLNYQSPQSMRSRSVRLLVSALEAQIDTDAEPGGRGQAMVLRIPAAAAATFEMLNRDLCQVHDDLELSSKHRDLGSVVEYRIDAYDAPLLLEGARALRTALEV